MRAKRGKVTWIHVNGRISEEVYKGRPIMWNVFYNVTDLHRAQKELEEKSKLLDRELKKAEQMKQWVSNFVTELSRQISSAAWRM